jgi:hypothetical protein
VMDAHVRIAVRAPKTKDGFEEVAGH